MAGLVSLPIMRRQNSGIMVNISSAVGGSAYVNTKFPVEGLSESYELEPFGIKVVLIEPRVIRTNIVNSMITAEKSHRNSPY
jgi:NAD(P)-dependent dehydrogenase (short-subunit alcohol dehydrogenase family)